MSDNSLTLENLNKELPNLGNVVNDGLGDDLRTAFEKVNAIFREIDVALLSAGKNLGTGRQVFKRFENSSFEFRTLESGSGVDITQFEDTIEISARPSFKSIATDSGTLNATSYENFVLRGGETIETNHLPGSQVITVDNVKIQNRNFVDILTSYDFGPINGKYDNAVQFVISNANIDFGTITEPTSTNFDAGEIDIQGIL